MYWTELSIPIRFMPLVSEIMTSRVSVVSPEETVDQCMALMTDKHLRHLPVMENDRLVGLVSIGDVVKAKSSAHATEIRYLQDYITGAYPG